MGQGVSGMAGESEGAGEAKANDEGAPVVKAAGTDLTSPREKEVLTFHPSRAVATTPARPTTTTTNPMTGGGAMKMLASAAKARVARLL